MSSRRSQLREFAPQPEYKTENGPAPREAEQTSSLTPDQHAILMMQQVSGNHAVTRHLQREALEKVPTVKPQAISDATRFRNDPAFAPIADGTTTLKKGTHNLSVTKVQQALKDLGYLFPKFGIDGWFGNETKGAIEKFQTDVGITSPLGEVDSATLDALNDKYDTRQPYVDNATFDPADPDAGTRKLSAEDRKNATNALSPRQIGKGGKPAKFQDDVGGDKYGDEIRTELGKLIEGFHKRLYADREPLRKDKDNLFDWSVIEGIAEEAKKKTDSIYGSLKTKNAELSNSKGTLVDVWEDQTAKQAAGNDADHLVQAQQGAEYLIENNMNDIHKKHSANPSGLQEKAIIQPIINEFTDSKDKVQKLLDIDTGWEGMQNEGTIFLQRYKAKTDNANRYKMWDYYFTSIHEYLHLLTHDDYIAYANKLGRKDNTKRNTLIEGGTDFFTWNVRSQVSIDDPLRQKIEGPYYDKNTAPVLPNDTYDSIEQAEELASIVGVHNLQVAYFRGDVSKIGGS